MEDIFNLLLGLCGTLLACIEIWRPNISKALESWLRTIKQNLMLFGVDLKTTIIKVGNNTEASFKEVMKGPRPMEFEELSASIDESNSNMLLALTTYLAIAVYIFIILPAYFCIKLLNYIGRGRAIGGVGIAINATGFLLQFYA